MRDVNEHLTLEEIRQASLCDEAKNLDIGLQQHVARCPECSEMTQQFETIMRRLDQFGKASGLLSREDCPESEAWLNLTASLLPPDEIRELLEHAGSCHRCSLQLKELLEIVGSSEPPPVEMRTSLKTSEARLQKRLGREMAARSTNKDGGIPESPVQSRTGFRVLSFPVWSFAAAAVVLVAVGVSAFFVLRPASPEKLLAQAYAQQRTLELRIPQAGFGPVQVQRDHRPSQLSKPGDLLEAEALIKRGLEKRPDDPELLRAEAEADLLNWDYQPAIETLGHALRIEPKSFDLLEDLGTAHFERAEATDNPADYEAALQSLSDALAVSPGSTTALFNRAIVYERLFLYDRAIADWELLLKVEKDDGWRQEAKKRLDDVRGKEQHHGARHQPEHLTLAKFNHDLTRDTSARAREAAEYDGQEYIDLAEREILPNISTATLEDPDYVAAVALAREFSSSHSDRFLDDLLQSTHQDKFHMATKLLGLASSSNYVGHSESAYSAAAQAADLFDRMNNNAGSLAARFEQIYALQFESHAAQCVAMSGPFVTLASRSGYAWLETQFLLEQAICSNNLDKFDDARIFAQRAMRVAEQHDYQGFYLRGLTALGALEIDTGHETSAWIAVREGLSRYWHLNLPDVRAYSLYVLLETMAEHMGHTNVQYAAIFEALRFVPDDHLVEAAERSRLGEAALRLGQADVAEEQFSRTAQLLSLAPQTESTQWRQLAARIGLVSAHAARGKYSKNEVAALAASLPEIRRLSNRYDVEPEYYATLAGIMARQGSVNDAQQLLDAAIHDAEGGLRSLSTWQERAAWMNQNREPYLMKTGLLLESGQLDSALEVWEQFRTASPEPLDLEHGHSAAGEPVQAAATLTNRLAPDTVVLTYAIADDGLLSWIRNKNEIHFSRVDVSAAEFKRTVANFIDECARPDSNMVNLRTDAQALYKWLVQPLEPWLPEHAHLIVEPDGILSILPFEALVTGTGDYFGARYDVMDAPTDAANHLHASMYILPSDPALIVSSPASSNGSLEPPPLASLEADRIASQFHSATVLCGRKATLASVEHDIGRNAIFHFAGHASFGSYGAALLLADGNLGIRGQAERGEQGIPRLGSMKLAVLSACGTARPSEMASSKSLVNEFLEDGVPEVVASRWNVDSGATTDYMTLFYRALLSGHSTADALHTASQTMRTTPGRSHPYYWAAFSGFGT